MKKETNIDKLSLKREVKKDLKWWAKEIFTDLLFFTIGIPNPDNY